MATNFPSSQDSFTNPTSSDTLDSPDHAAQHTDVNDAVEAIELALLDGAPLHIDDANERVGIGTSSPAVQLQLAGTDDREALRLSGDGGSGGNQGSVFMGFHHWATGTHPSARIGVIETDDADYDASLVFQTRSSDADVVPSTRMTINESGNVGIGTTSPDRGLHVDSPTAAVSAKFTSQHASLGLVELADSSSTSTAQIGTNGDDIVFRPLQTERMRIANSGYVGINDTTPSYQLDVNGDINTTGQYRIDGTQQGVWTSYTPTLYTGNYSGSPTHTLGSAGSITARYCVWGNVVFVQFDVSYGTFTAGNSTKQPRFSVPSGLRVVPTRGIGNLQGDFMGVGNMSGYQSHDYIGAMMAFNDGQHSSNGFFQFTQADSSSAGGNYNAYDAMFSGSTYFNDDLVTAYGRIAMQGWYRTDAL